MGKTHELKIFPEYFKSVNEGTKTFEIRKNDREFKVGDILILKEYGICEGVKGYSGQKITKEVSYILEGEQYGLEEGYVILALGEYKEMGNITDEEREIIQEAHIEHKKYWRLEEKLNITYSRIKQIEKEAIKKMEKYIA